MNAFFESKVKAPVAKLLKSGASPESVARAMAFGASARIFPIGGVRFLLVMLEIYALQLNAAAAMLAYYICSPFNMAVFPLFIYYGNMYFGEGTSDFSISQFMTDVKADPINTLLLFRFTLLNATYAWLVVAPALTFALYVVLTPVLRHVMAKPSATIDDEEKQQ
ncbi:hypothetical protein Gpo141_00001488 [Globisporangium polare]